MIIACYCISSYWFIIFGLFHAIWVFTFSNSILENTELHIGPRPKILFIVAGKSMQDPEEKKKV
jgi:hypothetical protein